MADRGEARAGVTTCSIIEDCSHFLAVEKLLGHGRGLVYIESSLNEGRTPSLIKKKPKYGEEGGEGNTAVKRTVLPLHPATPLQHNIYLPVRPPLKRNDQLPYSVIYVATCPPRIRAP